MEATDGIKKKSNKQKRNKEERGRKLVFQNEVSNFLLFGRKKAFILFNNFSNLSNK